MKTSISDTTRTEVWEEMEELYRARRYYQAQLGKYYRWSWVRRIMMGVVAIATLALEFLGDSLRIPLQDPINSILILVVLVFYFLEDTFKTSNKITVLTEIVSGSASILDEWRDFWGEVETHAVDEKMARYKNIQLKRRRTALYDSATRIFIPIDNDLNTRCTELAVKDMQNIKFLYGSNDNNVDQDKSVSVNKDQT